MIEIELWVCDYPSCVEVIEVKSFVPIPLSVEEIVIWVCGYPSCVEVIVVGFSFVPIPLCAEVIVVWLSALSLLCRDDCCFGFVPYFLCRGGCVRERSCVLLTLYLQISQWRFPMWEVLCGRSENPFV